MAIKVEIKHEKQGIGEYGYGVYVNGYIRDDAFPLMAGEADPIYASECVPHGKATAAALKRAEKRVRRRAMREYKKEMTQLGG